MFENIANFFKRFGKNDKENSSMAAKERLHLVLAQDRANISADFLEMMKQEIIDVIKKYIDIDEEAIDVRMTNKAGEDGIVGAPALYANIPIVTIKNEARKLEGIIAEKNKDISEDENKQNMNIKKETEKNIQVDKYEDNEEKTSNINTEKQENKTQEINVESVETSSQNIAKELKQNKDNEKSKTKSTSNKKQEQKTASKAVNKKNTNTKSKSKIKKK